MLPAAIRSAIRDKMSNNHPSKRVTRDAFLYVDSGNPHFAQCGTCWLFDRKNGMCNILGTEVGSEDSCGYYGPGPFDPGVETMRRFTPKEVGLVRRQVRCENCWFYDSRDSHCDLYRHLNEVMPTKFNLDENVRPRGCCNAQEPR